MQQFDSSCHVLYGLADEFQGFGHSLSVSMLDTIDCNRNVLEHRSRISGLSLHSAVLMTLQNSFFPPQTVQGDYYY